MTRNSRLVYSTELGRIPPQEKAPSLPKGDGIARVRREKQGRGGKVVTTISGVLLPDSGLKELASDLKRCCGAGGSVKNGVIEIQGDHAESVISELEKRGYKARRAGG